MGIQITAATDELLIRIIGALVRRLDNPVELSSDELDDAIELKIDAPAEGGLILSAGLSDDAAS